MPTGVDHLTVEAVVAIHDGIVAASSVTSPGVRDRGGVAFAVEGPGRPDRDHRERAAALCRYLVANHPFVDGNKRTALAAVATGYALTGDRLDYDDDVRSLLKRIGTDDRVGIDEIAAGFRGWTVEAVDDPVPDPDRERLLALARADRERHRAIYEALATE